MSDDRTTIGQIGTPAVAVQRLSDDGPHNLDTGVSNVTKSPSQEDGGGAENREQQGAASPPFEVRRAISWVLFAINLVLFMTVVAGSDSHRFHPQQLNVKLVSSTKALAGAIEPGAALTFNLPVSPILRGCSSKQPCPPPTSRQFDLVIDGLLLQSSKTSFGEPIQTLHFTLPTSMDATSKEGKLVASIWSPLHASRITGGLFDAPFNITANATDGAIKLPEFTISGTIRLKVYDSTSFMLGAVLFVIFSGSIIWVSAWTGALHEPSDGSWSLSRTQMCLWFVLITSAFVVIWLTTGAWENLINGNVLALLGITTVTGFASAAAVPDADKGKTMSQSDLRTGSYFLQDILSETGKSGVGGGSVSLPRIVAATWTLILAAIFIETLFETMQLTNFDSTLLVLMGVTNGVYVGIKKLQSA